MCSCQDVQQSTHITLTCWRCSFRGIFPDWTGTSLNWHNQIFEKRIFNICFKRPFWLTENCAAAVPRQHTDSWFSALQDPSRRFSCPPIQVKLCHYHRSVAQSVQVSRTHPGPSYFGCIHNPTHCTFLAVFSIAESKSRLRCDRWSVFVWVHDKTVSCGLVCVRQPLWREVGSIICQGSQQ